jgi:Domain of unknown function (DUF4398)
MTAAGNPTLSKTLLAALMASVLVACAGPPERPVAEMTRARTLIEQAEERGAQERAGAELERARGKYRQAEAAIEDRDPEQARRLALQAAVDAEYAAARASSKQAREAAEEMDRTIRTLREEAERRLETPPG